MPSNKENRSYGFYGLSRRRTTHLFDDTGEEILGLHSRVGGSAA